MEKRYEWREPKQRSVCSYRVQGQVVLHLVGRRGAILGIRSCIGQVDASRYSRAEVGGVVWLEIGRATRRLLLVTSLTAQLMGLLDISRNPFICHYQGIIPHSFRIFILPSTLYRGNPFCHREASGLPDKSQNQQTGLSNHPHLLSQDQQKSLYLMVDMLLKVVRMERVVHLCNR